MKASIKGMDIDYGLLNFTQHLVPISDFSRGKTAQLFDDVKNNNTEYVVLKNNQPTAMVIAMRVLMRFAKSLDLMRAKLSLNVKVWRLNSVGSKIRT